MAALLLYCAIALVLIYSEKPVISAGDSLDFSRAPGGEGVSAELIPFVTRDGSTLSYRRYGKDNGPLIIIIHGSGAHSGLYDTLTHGLTHLGSIVVPDLRGHGGQTPVGDVSYIGQLEDDLADLISETRSDANQNVILVGHSSGGGLAVRFAGNPAQPKPDGVVLLAPYLGYNAPTTRLNSGGWAQPLSRRMTGLVMLNALRIRFLNHLTVILFRLPDNGKELKMTSSYSYRLNTSFAPRYDFKRDIARLPKFKILIGRNDEAFLASEFSPLLDSFENNGSVQLFDELSHLDVFADNGVHAEIAKFVSDFSSK